jgi:hypothetical protein
MNSCRTGQSLPIIRSALTLAAGFSLALAGRVNSGAILQQRRKRK